MEAQAGKPPAPYYHEDQCTIYCGEALEVLRTLEPQRFDLLLTDPPYSSGGMFRGDRAQDPKQKYLESDSEHRITLASFTGDTRSELGHLFWCGAWLGRCSTLLKQGAIAAIFSDWRQLPATVLALQAGGFVWRGIVPWHKPGARPTQGRWSNECEYVVWGTNGPRELAGTTFPGMYSVRPPRERHHLTEKPVSLLRELMRVVPEGGEVLDPFMGTGTMLRAARDLGLAAVGIEIEPRFCEVGRRRLSQTSLALSTNGDET